MSLPLLVGYVHCRMVCGDQEIIPKNTKFQTLIALLFKFIIQEMSLKSQGQSTEKKKSSVNNTL